MALNRNRPIRPPRSIEKRTDSLDNVEALKQDLRDIFKPKEIEPEIKPKLHASKLPERDTQSSRDDDSVDPRNFFKPDSDGNFRKPKPKTPLGRIKGIFITENVENDED